MLHHNHSISTHERYMKSNAFALNDVVIEELHFFVNL